MKRKRGLDEIMSGTSGFERVVRHCPLETVLPLRETCTAFRDAVDREFHEEIRREISLKVAVTDAMDRVDLSCAHRPNDALLLRSVIGLTMFCGMTVNASVEIVSHHLYGMLAYRVYITFPSARNLTRFSWDEWLSSPVVSARVFEITLPGESALKFIVVGTRPGLVEIAQGTRILELVVRNCNLHSAMRLRGVCKDFRDTVDHLYPPDLVSSLRRIMRKARILKLA